MAMNATKKAMVDVHRNIDRGSNHNTNSLLLVDQQLTVFPNIFQDAIEVDQKAEITVLEVDKGSMRVCQAMRCFINAQCPSECPLNTISGRHCSNCQLSKKIRKQVYSLSLSFSICHALAKHGPLFVHSLVFPTRTFLQIFLCASARSKNQVMERSG